LIERLLEQTIKLWLSHSAPMEIGVRRREDIPQTELSKRQPRLDGFDNEGADALARRFGLSPKAVFSCRR
jgi:hypothetical protein